MNSECLRNLARYSTIIILIVATLGRLALAQPTPELFYDISVKLPDSREAIDIDMSICYEGSPSDQNVFFLFSSLATVKSAHLVHDSGAIPLEWTHGAADTLRIDYPVDRSPGKKFCIRIKYALPCSQGPSSDIMLRREERWYPVVPTSPFRYRIAYQSPGNYTVLSSGDKVQEDLVGGTKQGVWTQMNPTFTLPLLFLNDSLLMTHEIESSKGVTVKYYGRSTVDSAIISILNTCAQSLDYLDEKLSPYPYSHLSIVEIPDFKAVQSLAGLLLVGEMFIKYYWYEGFHDWPSHEVAHQWIGHTILTNSLQRQPGRLFVEESLAEYMRILFLRKTLGVDAADSVLESYRETMISVVREYTGPSLYELTSMSNRDEGKIVYQYGPLVLEKLESHLGQDKWQALLDAIVDRYYFKPFTYRHLQETLISISGDSASVALVDGLIRGTTDMFPDETE